MPRLTLAKIFQRLDDGQVDPLYLFYGEETYYFQDYTEHLSARILGTSPRDFNYDAFSAESDSLSEALGIARTLPMMASHRVVVFHGLQQLRKADLQQIEAYAEKPSESTALICSSTEGNIKKLPSRFWDKSAAVECKRLEGESLRAWVVKTAAGEGYSMSSEAAQALLQEQQNDLWTIRREVEKICTYMGDTKTISLTDVQEVGYASRQRSIFALSDAIGARQTLPALAVIDALLKQGEPPLVVFSLMVRHLRLLWSVMQLQQQHQSPAQMAKALGVPPHICRRLATQSRRYTSARLQQLYAAALAADLAFKTSNKPPKLILEGLILELCAAG